MKKALVMLGAGVVSFLVVFAFTTRDEIGAEVANRLDSDFTKQCVARAQFPPQVEDYAEEICDCMKAEFDERELAITDAFGSQRGEMQRITQECVQEWI
ncbi:hypothetical protein P7228_11945 [Altererythrobacter arenosus]|uniref:Uncharacterized protein n=1 Tax=Altererythrobacter arenosus TaxID=3032592 RepID=A0ABY8FR44_9SPHN|nr:hypothetical protein [Altererythrobacter sp. CAU 1644]WFL76705.1 hypothetical protein P7228_11945 [Altererythrobacter sp. CAU 1644]